MPIHDWTSVCAGAYLDFHCTWIPEIKRALNGGVLPQGFYAMTEQHGDAPPHWLPYVLVDDCNESAAKVTQLGGNILVPPTDVPNVGRFAVFTDPAGACLAIIKLNT